MEAQKTRAVTVVGFILSLIVAVLIVSQMAMAPSTTQAQVDDDEAPATLPRTLTVVGQGMVNVEPDIAEATIGVQVTEADVKAASDEAEQKMEAILTALREQNIAERDIQTSGFNIFAEQPPLEPGRTTTEATVYRVSNNVSVIVRELDQVGAVLDAAIEAGANNIFGVNFSIDAAGASRSEARQEAMRSAQSKAQELAQLAGVELDEIISVSEVIGSGGPPPFQAEAIGGAGGRGGGGPISPGALEITTQLEVVYAIR